MDDKTARDIVNQLNASLETLRDARPDADAVRQAAKVIRQRVPLADHRKTAFAGSTDERLALVVSVEAGRRADLLAKRRKKMSVDPFSFFRGSAMLMAADLRGTPSTDHRCTVCGDAHCENFGMYGSPELVQVFDLSDFDEATQERWEWDVKRLAASMVLADRARENGVHVEREAARSAVRAYRAQLADCARQETLLGRRLRALRASEIIDALPADVETRRRAEKIVKAAERTIAQNFNDMIAVKDGKPRFEHDKKGHTAKLGDGDGDVTKEQLRSALDDGYLESLGRRKELLRGFREVDEGFRIVGVGSIGLRDFLVALDGRDADDLVVLQVKQAQVSQLLAARTGRRRARDHWP